MDLPEITQQPVLLIDATPDEEYVLRILRAYRQNCDCRWVSTEPNNEPNKLLDMMNEHCEQRATLLDKAIAILEADQIKYSARDEGGYPSPFAIGPASGGSITAGRNVFWPEESTTFCSIIPDPDFIF